MLSCKKAADLIDKKSETKLSWKDNMQLRAHISMCDACTAYQKQSKLIDHLLEKHFYALSDSKNLIFENKELKTLIISKLKTN